MAGNRNRDLTRNPHAAPGAAPSAVPPCILVVEDDPLLARVLHRRLSDAGYAVEWASNGQVALQVLTTMPDLPDLILTDLLMPGVGGYDLCARVRDTPRLAHLPIVVMTSNDGPEYREPIAALGIFRYLVKPVPLPDLLATVGAAMSAGPPDDGGPVSATP